MTVLSVIDYAALALVMAIGVPHGAFDGAVASHLGLAATWRRTAGFIAAYIGIAALALGVWMLFPVLSLCAFLAYSLVHFGLGDLRPVDVTQARLGRYLKIFLYGGLSIVLIPAMHWQDVSVLFMMLTGGVDVEILGQVMRYLGIGWGILFVVFSVMVLRGKQDKFSLTELYLTAMFVVILPPLVGFAIYFCAIHSRKHFQLIWQKLWQTKNGKPMVKLAIIFTAVSWVMMATAIALGTGIGSFDEAVIRAVFIGLSCLTIPHMMLIDGLFRPKLNH